MNPSIFPLKVANNALKVAEKLPLFLKQFNPFKNLSLLCEAVDQYALQWAKQEIVELSVLHLGRKW